MATTATGFAIELPTSRQSRYYDGPPPNVHDPNYIPVLNRADLKVDFSQPSFSALPSIPKPHENESQTSLHRSKSASAPETVVQTRTPPVPPKNVVSKYAAPQEIGSSYHPRPRPRDIPRSPSHSGDNTTTSGSESSSAAPAAALEEHVFMIPGNSAPRSEEIQLPILPSSARSSFSSTHRSNVPTSRFNNKSPSIPSLPPNVIQMAQTPPMPSSSTPDLRQRQIADSAQSTPTIPAAVEVAPVSPAVSTPRLHAMKSTASERRARALHSHPANMSIKIKRSSIAEEADEIPLISDRLQPESRTSSTRSRTQSICNSTQPFPAPNSPLPDLPPGAKRPPTREKPSEKPLPVVNPSPLSSPPLKGSDNEHMEMAEFMTTQKTMVFRRFDEVHARLLLQLQDEIATLERDLKAIDDAGLGKLDNVSAKTNIMKELRRLLAEYDHLFSNWCSMQANKATPEAKERLEKWLQSPSLVSGKIPQSAMDDLRWLQNSKDLSSVLLDQDEKPATMHSKEKPSRDSSFEDGAAGGGGVMASFLALFGCASKRK